MRTQRISTLLTMIATATLVACGAAAAPAASSAATSTPALTSAPTATATATLNPAALVNSPKAAGFVSTVLIERKRALVGGAPSYIRIASGDAGADVLQTKISDSESFTASYRAATSRTDGSAKAAYESADLPPLAAGTYTEGLRQVVVQPDGHSAAHKHAGFEAVLVLEGTVMVRAASTAPVTLQKGQGFSILPNTPIQLFNIGTTVARTLVYSITADGLPFSTELDASP